LNFNSLLDVFEDIGTTYKLGLINKDLVYSSFSFYVSRWWEVCKAYIYEERKRLGDVNGETFGDFEMLAKEMRGPDEEMDLVKFLSDEKQFLNP